MKRRDFFKNAMGLAGAVIVAPILLTALRTQAEGRSKPAAGGGLVDPKDPTAAAVGYIKISKAAGKDCANCALYVSGDKGNGTCAIFPGKLVLGKAYCNSWAKKS